MYDVEELRRSPASRRAFLTAMTAAGLGFAADQLLGGRLISTASAGPSALPGTPTDGAQQFAAIPGENLDIKVLNFALTLEILEADLYRQALNIASGFAVSTPLASNASVYKLKVSLGGLNPYTAQDLFAYLVEFSYVEAAHRDFLRATIPQLGGTPTKPNPRGYKFTRPVAPNLNDIMSSILPLEETGVRAYLGAAPYLSTLGLIQVAGTIFSTEARHSGVISESLPTPADAGPHPMPGDLKVTPSYPSPNTFEYYLKPATVVARASAYFA